MHIGLTRERATGRNVIRARGRRGRAHTDGRRLVNFQLTEGERAWLRRVRGTPDYIRRRRSARRIASQPPGDCRSGLSACIMYTRVYTTHVAPLSDRSRPGIDWTQPCEPYSIKSSREYGLILCLPLLITSFSLSPPLALSSLGSSS